MTEYITIWHTQHFKGFLHSHYNKYILKGCNHCPIYGHNFDGQSQAVLLVLRTAQSSWVLTYNKK